MPGDLLRTWVPVAGRWRLEETTATYLGPEDAAIPLPRGVVLSDLRFRSGSITVQVSLNETDVSAGRIVFGYNVTTGAYFSCGLGGHDVAYVLVEFVPTIGWRPVAASGNKVHLNPQANYALEVRLRGQSVSLTVNKVEVLERTLPYPITGDQIGLFAWGPGGVRFKDVVAIPIRPKAFVVMQYGEPFDSLFSEVIRPVAEATGLEAYRASDVFKPGVILTDIIQGIREAEVVIAEITPVNANVFYELGFSHAMEKATILLAERGHELPFDIRSYRCIFYDNTIGGKARVESDLKKHLASILNGK